ncbi:Ig-like domain-containing protein, partial [Desulforhopalus singaporensis]|uniref:Ig-like domain-containing protein n=1 Tax=Desulforhopalus singaporensis TaxID=91360 RepID=UPI001C40B030
MQGPVYDNGVTNDIHPTVFGTGGKVGDVVTIYTQDGTVVATTTVSSNGSWNVNLANQSGTVEYTATLTDPAGNESDPSGTFTVTYDVTAPDTPNTPAIVTDNVGEIVTVGAGDTTDDNRPTFSGTGQEAGETITLYDGNDQVIATTVVDTDGSWKVELDPANTMTDGEQSVTYTVTDEAGNTSGRSPEMTFVVDTSSVSVEISYLVDDAGEVTDNVFDGGFTDDATPEIWGTASAGATVELKLSNGTILATGIAPDNDGNWNYKIPATDALTPDGAYKLIATATNPAGGSVETEFTVTIDTTPPAASVEITAITEDTGVAGDFITND